VTREEACSIAILYILLNFVIGIIGAVAILVLIVGCKACDIPRDANGGRPGGLLSVAQRSLFASTRRRIEYGTVVGLSLLGAGHLFGRVHRLPKPFKRYIATGRVLVRKVPESNCGILVLSPGKPDGRAHINRDCTRV